MEIIRVKRSWFVILKQAVCRTNGILYKRYSIQMVRMLYKQYAIQTVCYTNGMLYKRYAIQTVCYTNGMLYKRYAVQTVCYTNGMLYKRYAIQTVCYTNGMLYIWPDKLKDYVYLRQEIIIGASLSEPHTSEITLLMCMCIHACLYAAIYFKF